MNGLSRKTFGIEPVYLPETPLKQAGRFSFEYQVVARGGLPRRPQICIRRKARRCFTRMALA